MKQAKWFLLLHVILGIYAGSSVCSKLAAQQPFLSAAFIVLYGLMLLALVVSAIVGTCGMLIGYACVRRRGSRLSRMVESLAFFPYLMPAMAFATIYLAVATSANFCGASL